MKKYLKFGLVFLALLAACYGWYFLWQRVERSISDAEFGSEISTFQANDAYYMRLDTDGLRAYLPDADGVSEALCGDPLGPQAFQISAGTVTGKAYTLKGYVYTSAAPPVEVVELSGKYYAYELVGFRSLDNSPTVQQVFEAYGITGADAIAEIAETDAETKKTAVYSDADTLAERYSLYRSLGAPMTDAQSAQAYYDAYVKEYGETEQLAIEEGEVRAKDEDTYEKAMSLWGKGMYTADISLKNGLKLRGCMCAPVPGIFGLYANYPMPE